MSLFHSRKGFRFLVQTQTIYGQFLWLLKTQLQESAVWWKAKIQLTELCLWWGEGDMQSSKQMVGGHVTQLVTSDKVSQNCLKLHSLTCEVRGGPDSTKPSVRTTNDQSELETDYLIANEK